MNFVLHHYTVEIDIETNNYPSPSTGEGRGEGVEKFLPPTFILPLKRLCHNMKKPIFRKRGEAVGWKRFRAVTFSRSDSYVPGV